MSKARDLADSYTDSEIDSLDDLLAPKAEPSFTGKVGIGTSNPLPYTNNIGLEINSIDPIIRLRDSDGATDVKSWEIRNIGAAAGAGYEGLQFRRWNDAETSATEFMRIDNSGDVILSGGIYLGGTGSANKLDDYEEGTFTPVVKTALNGTVLTPITDYTFESAEGMRSSSIKYLKIGNQVFFNFTFSSNIAASYRLNISLPFAVASNSYQLVSSCSWYRANVSGGIGILGASASTFDTFAIDEAGSHISVPLQTTTEIYYNFNYTVA